MVASRFDVYFHQPTFEFRYDIESIVATRLQPLKRGTKARRLEYLVKWAGYESEENTWEPEDNLVNVRRNSHIRACAHAVHMCAHASTVTSLRLPRARYVDHKTTPL